MVPGSRLRKDQHELIQRGVRRGDTAAPSKQKCQSAEQALLVSVGLWAGVGAGSRGGGYQGWPGTAQS